MIPAHVIDSPPQANATGYGAVPVGEPEGQQPTPLALRNQLEAIIGALRLAYARLGELPPDAIDRQTFTGLQDQYALLMDNAGQLAARLNNLGPVLGEDLGLAKELNRLQGDVEMYIGAVESSLMAMMAQLEQLEQQGNGQAVDENGQRRWVVEPGEAVLEPMPNGGNGGNGNADANGPALAPVPAPNRNYMRWGLVLGGLLILGGAGYYYYRQQGGVTAAY
jgi:hypothetical protein